jgi:uncharacterized protein with ParB-like and HNH nuclease domain
MRSIPRSIYDLFGTHHRYVVPLFQRQYVWNKNVQWEPLWNDILSKATDRLERGTSHPHFMGAMVFEQIQTFGNQVHSHTVIDGQQRLTTLQLFLSAFRNLATKNNLRQYANDIERHITNSGLIDEARRFEEWQIERFKVWPTKSDQLQFSRVIISQSREDLEAIYPPVFLRRKLQPRPRMVEAYLYFDDVLTEFLLDVDLTQTVEERISVLHQVMNNDLQVVSIELEDNDDAQIIFETLNARGQPLLPSDLLRNFIFRRADQNGENQDLLYERYWKIFEDSFWHTHEKQGRLKRPRIDLFMQHFLALKKASDVNVGHLFDEYKLWMTNVAPYVTVEDELVDLVRYAQAFHRLSDRDASVFGDFGKRLGILDISTIYPLLLHLLADADMSESDLEQAGRYLESYLVRRLICGKGTKNYNKSFLLVMRELQMSNGGTQDLRNLLLTFTGSAGVWPDDNEFEEAWMTQPVYETIGTGRVEMVLRAIEAEMQGALNEEITIHSRLSVEHIMPQTWETHWGTAPQISEPNGVPEPSERAATRRDRIVQTFGNLTLLVQPLNSSVSNGPFITKRESILQNSVLRLNGYLRDVDSWDERAIQQRGRALFEIAKQIWPYPTNA